LFGKERSGITPLHIAADSGNVDIIQELLDHGAQINSPDRWKFRTPLDFAVSQGHERAVALLLSRGAALDGDYRAWSSPLILAASKNYEAIVRMLLDRVLM
jgi:ankyrin repeat protein